jgi:hypothetical protein
LLRSLLRILILLGAVFAVYALWEPGLDVRDGRHDRGRNGLWLAHGWLGGDDWFSRNAKQDQLPAYRRHEALAALAYLCGVGLGAIWSAVACYRSVAGAACCVRRDPLAQVQ